MLALDVSPLMSDGPIRKELEMAILFAAYMIEVRQTQSDTASEYMDSVLYWHKTMDVGPPFVRDHWQLAQVLRSKKTLSLPSLSCGSHNPIHLHLGSIQHAAQETRWSLRETIPGYARYPGRVHS